MQDEQPGALCSLQGPAQLKEGQAQIPLADSCEPHPGLAEDLQRVRRQPQDVVHHGRAEALPEAGAEVEAVAPEEGAGAAEEVGAQVGLAEGVELHLLGLTLGVDLWPPQVKLPFLPAIPWQLDG